MGRVASLLRVCVGAFGCSLVDRFCGVEEGGTFRFVWPAERANWAPGLPALLVEPGINTGRSCHRQEVALLAFSSFFSPFFVSVVRVEREWAWLLVSSVFGRLSKAFLEVFDWKPITTLVIRCYINRLGIRYFGEDMREGGKQRLCLT